MPTTQILQNGGNPDAGWLYRLGGLSGLVIGIGYLVIIGLYVPLGAPPTAATARLEYLSANPAAWWIILGLSVFTDLLFVPLMFALYDRLRGIHRGLMLLASACVLLFVVVDLAVTWTNYAVLIELGGEYVAAAAPERSAIVTAATYPAAVLSSTLLGVHIILIPGVGIALAGLAMLRGVFSRTAAYLGVATGVFAAVAVIGPFFVGALGAAAVLASVLTMVWTMVSGSELYRLGRAG